MWISQRLHKTVHFVIVLQSSGRNVTNRDITPRSGRTPLLYHPVQHRHHPGVTLVLLSNAFDCLGAPQSLCGLSAPLCVVVVVVLERSDLVLKLLADFHCGAVTSDFRRKYDVPNMGEGVVHHPRLGVISAQVLQVITGVLSCLPIVVASRRVYLCVEYRLPT